MRTFIELKKISLEKEHVETKDFPESGFYVLENLLIDRSDIFFVDKIANTLLLICPIRYFNRLNLKILEEEIICKYNESKEKTTEEKKHPALPNYAKAEESLKALNEKLGQTFPMPEAELISEGMVSADFVLEFAKILLSKK